MVQVLWWIFAALWAISVVVWAVFIIVPKTRDRNLFFYPLIAQLVFCFAMNICNLFM